MLQKILNADFPSEWPDFFDRTMQLLATNDASSVYAGLQCMVALCRMYRFKSGETRTEFNQVVLASFPQLLAIANGLVQETSPDAWEMLHIVMKAYKHAIYVGHTRYPGPDETLGCGICLVLMGFLVRIASSPYASRPDGWLVHPVSGYCRKRSPRLRLGS